MANLEFSSPAFASNPRRYKMKTYFTFCKHSSHILVNKFGCAVFISQI